LNHLLFCLGIASLASLSLELIAPRLAKIYSFYGRGREPMAREPDLALLMTTSGSLDIFLTRLLRMKLFL